jgi:hypothetical protein
MIIWFFLRTSGREVNSRLTALPLRGYCARYYYHYYYSRSNNTLFQHRCLLRRWAYPSLGRIFGLKRDANGKWRSLRNEEFHILCRLPNTVRVINSRIFRWASNAVRMNVDKPTVNKPLWSPRHRWEDDIRMNIKEIGINQYEGLGWFG